MKKLKSIEEILSRVPGDTVIARAKACGVCRTTFYQWISGRCRPNVSQASRLAEITGFAIDEISSQKLAAMSPLTPRPTRLRQRNRHDLPM